MDWNEIINTNNPDYEPTFTITNCSKEVSGTSIILKKLKRKSDFDKSGLAIGLSRLFNLFDTTFKVYITLNDDEPIEVNDKLKYQGLTSQFKWSFPNFLETIAEEYEDKEQIVGEIFSTEKPLKPGLRGITLFAKGRLVNVPEFFGVSESSHGYSYFTGWLNVDFIDDWEKDVISTDRQSLNWDLPETEELREYLKRIMLDLERDWRQKRKENKEKEIAVRTQLNIPGWYSKLPENIHDTLVPIVSAVMYDSELPAATQSQIVNGLHALIPEYPYFHWRHLHANVQDASRTDYERKDYYRAFEETIKRYISEVRRKSSCGNPTDNGMMGEVFGRGKILQVACKYKKTDGSDFTPSTIENIEEGQKFLSMGILSGARNPVAHEEVAQLKDSGLFSEKDCLDALSLLSHLFRRLDDA